ncbi:hypothetical protein K501DRAFT_328675 [Backusella circina FSU 941]|nr:hypothetical protein K501DRAFT_328675 [Backusella circina FSU 941]
MSSKEVQRRLSLPDLNKLKAEWDSREAIQANAQIGTGKLQIDLLNVRSDVAVRRPVMRLRMGSQHYFSSRSKHKNGNWNEGFLFTISYHNQLFDTIELDLYDKKSNWRSKTKHIGKAKLKIAKLKDRSDVFITFLPMYEYHVRRYLPAHIQLPHTFLKSHMPNMSRLTQNRYAHKITTRLNGGNKNGEQDDQEDEFKDLKSRIEITPYQVHPSHSKHSMTPFIGSIQVRVRYSFQHPPPDSEESDTLTIQKTDFDACSFTSSHLDRITLNSTATDGKSRRSSISSTASSSSVESGFHDAVEPKLILVDTLDDRLSCSPTTPTPSILPQSDSTVDLTFQKNIEKLQPSNKKVVSIEQEVVDFPKRDGENKKKTLLSSATSNNGKKKSSGSSSSNASIISSDTASIKSHNFGDKNFAFRWINESFEEVALSHPSLDRMIGMVVSPQTRILLRAVVKMCNAFGQGFKITVLQLLSSLSLLQNFYSDIPRAPPAEKVTDLKFLDESYYFLGHAIIAYGWRGISYLGDYAKYLKDVMKTKSNKEAIVRYLKIPQEDLLGYEYGLRKGAVFQPSYFVSYDQGHEAVVLGIRGTWSLYDCITDLVCEYRPWKGGLVHSGMLASAQWFFTRIIPQIFLYVGEQTKAGTRKVKSFIITGHSLGAGTAAILTMMVADHIDQLRELSNNPDFRVHCYSYAPVASVSHDLSEKYKHHIDSFVCHDDLVARLSYGTASCAKELIMDSLIAVDGLGGNSKVNADPKIRKECFDIIQTRRKEIYHGNEPRYPLLYVPGRVFQFRRGSKVTSKSSKNDTNIPLPGTNPNDRPRAASINETNNKKKFPVAGAPSFLSSHSEPALPTNSNNNLSDVTFTLHRSSPMLSEEVLISKTCLEDHMIVTYLNAFQMVRQDCMRQDAAIRDLRKDAKSSTYSFSSSSSTLRQSSTTASISPSSTNIKLSENVIPFIQVENPHGDIVAE